MGKNEEIVLKIAKWAFGICFLISGLFFVIGEAILPDESGPRAMLADSDGVNCEIFESDWERLMPDGTSYPVDVPGQYEAYPGEGVTVMTVLPDDIAEQTWLCFQSRWQDMEIYVDGIMRERYSTKDTRPFGKNSPIAYVFVELNREDAGKTLKVLTNSDSGYTGSMKQVYIGDKFGIWLTFLEWHGTSMILEATLLVLSLVGIVVCVVLSLYLRKNIPLLYLCCGVFCVATWLFSETEFRQLIFSNVSVIAVFTFTSLMFLPISLLIYINEIQEQRYGKFYLAVIGMAFCNMAYSMYMQITSQKDLFEILVLSHIIIGISSFLVLITVILDWKNGYLKRYSLIGIGLLSIVLAGVIEVLIFYVDSRQPSGRFLCIGMAVLMTLAITKTINDVLRGEKEKQRALMASESKAKFLANMSHEIRTPINTILGMNEMILRENVVGEVREYAQNIQHSGNMLLALINDILDFSKIDAGEIEMNNKSYQPQVLLKEIIFSLQVRAESKGLRVITEIDKQIPAMLSGDEFRIRQVLNNLLSNALKYTNEGSVTLAVHGEWWAEEQFYLCISVKDTGIGIRPDDMDKLFQAFTRLEEERNRNIEGTGLGLSITRQLVECMGGKIEVHSVYGEGTEFCVRLPQAVVEKSSMEMMEKEKKRVIQNEVYRKAYTAPDAIILAVDDNEMNLEVVKGLLKDTNIQVDIAKGGEEGLKLTRSKQYDLILMDHMMPTPDGIETLHRLRAEEGNPNRDTKVVVLTANALAGCREEYIKEGFDDYLSKPLDIVKLEMMVAEKLPGEKVIYVEGQERETSMDKQSKTVQLQQESGCIDRKTGMMYCGDNIEMYCAVIKSYISQKEKYLNGLPQYYEQKDWKNYGVLVHALKSTSLSIGAKSFSEFAKSMEMAAKAGDEGTIIKGHEYLCSTYQQVLSEAGLILASQEEETAVQKKTEPVSKEERIMICKKLLDYIHAYEMLEVEEHIKKLKTMVEDDSCLMKVESYIADFDYDGAEECVLELIDQFEKE